MEQPIARKIHRNPRDFIFNSPHKKKASNLYTFNPSQSRYDSGDKQHLNISEENPEVPLPQLTASDQPKIYYDAEGEKQKPEQIQLQVKKPEISQISSNSRYFNFGSFEDKIYSPQNRHRSSQQPQQLEKATSGFIIKQKLLKNKSHLDLQSQQRNHTTQRQFNRLALSLMGVKRSKFQKSFVQKKTSFHIHSTAPTRSFRQSGDSSKNNEEICEIYKHSIYPFPAKKIDHIMEEVNRISGESRLRRYSPHDKQVEVITPFIGKQESQRNAFAEIYAQHDWQVKISIKTSLSALKNLLTSGIQANHIYIEVPSFFYKPPSQLKKINSFNAQILNNQCTHIFTSLSIPIVNINIRKYSNCIVIVNSNICIVWHEGKEGKKYIGSWQNKYFDEGEKEGLGLEWVPGRYVYYGQFKANKRDGFGVMRKNDETVVIGFWRRGKYQQFGIQKNYAS